MTKPRLPVADLANICTLPRDQQPGRLVLKRQFVAPYSLNPVRRNQGMLLGVRPGLDPTHDSPSEARLLRELARATKGVAEEAANLKRGQALLDFAKSYVTEAAEESYRSHRITYEAEIRLTDPFRLVIGGKAYVPFSDLRKSGTLTLLGREFCFSMNYHLVIAADPYFEKAGLLMMDYWENRDGSFGIMPHFFAGPPRYSYEELTDMIAFTYQLWDEIVEESFHRRRATGTEGPLC